MFSDPERFVGFDTTLVTCFRGVFRVNFHDVTATLSSVVFQKGDEVTPPDFVRIPTIPAAFQLPFTFRFSTNTASYSVV